MPRHYPAELRRRTCERMLAGEAVKDLVAELRIEQGLIVNKKLVWKIMRQLGIRGLPGPKRGRKNLKNAATCEDLVQRQFTATAPNELWLTDITEHSTVEGKLYC